MLLVRDFKKMGKFLKAKRTAANLSQTEVAQKLGYTSPQLISNFERGLCAPPVKSLKTLIDLYGLDPNEIVKRILDEEKAFLMDRIKKRK